MSNLSISLMRLNECDTFINVPGASNEVAVFVLVESIVTLFLLLFPGHTKGPEMTTRYLA